MHSHWMVGAALALSGAGCSLEVTATIAHEDGGGTAVDASAVDAGPDGPPADGGAMDAGAVDDGGLDAGPRDGGAPDAGAPDAGAPFCDASDPSLVVCLRFEDNLDDESSSPHTVSASDHGFASGRVGRALSVDDAASVWLEQSGELARLPLTVELWLSSRALPVGDARQGIIDIDGLWSIFLYERGDIACRRNGDAVALGAITAGTFAHIACVFIEGQNQIYVDGVLRDTVTASASSGSSTEDARLGGNSPDSDELEGLLDEMRVFSVERTAGEIATAAAR